MVIWPKRRLTFIVGKILIDFGFQGRRFLGFVSHDRKIIMSDNEDVLVRHSPEDVFDSKEVAKQSVKEEKFRPSPKLILGFAYDISPHKDHYYREIANKSQNNSLSSRLEGGCLVLDMWRIFDY